MNCSGLTSIDIPSNVTSIGDLAFVGCSNLTTVNLRCNNVIDANIDTLRPFGSIGSSIPKINLYVPSGLIDSYRQNYYWSQRCNIDSIPQ